MKRVGLLVHHEGGPCTKPKDYDPELHQFYGGAYTRHAWFEHVDVVGFAYCPACEMWRELAAPEAHWTLW
jgi:hypothetical protein